ncbi:MAG TPA: hypothetical protein VN848_01820 [Gemmatimonadales bacterium]|nr:hypothetical protein [Gemmatimonadales bacterium]
MWRGLAVLTLLTGTAAPSPAQQSAPALSILVQTGVPRIQVTNLLENGQFVSLMRAGLPLRLHYRLELWRSVSNWFDAHVREAGWDAVAHYDPLADDFVLVRSGGATMHASTPEALERVITVPYKVTLTPSGPGRYYYICRLDVTTLSETDLAEIEAWLKGEVAPAVKGGGDLGDAIVRGAQRVLVRIAGLPRLSLEARSEPFRVGPGN